MRRLRRRDTLGQTQRLREAKADRDGHSEAGKESLRGKRSNRMTDGSRRPRLRTRQAKESRHWAARRPTAAAGPALFAGDGRESPLPCVTLEHSPHLPEHWLQRGPRGHHQDPRGSNMLWILGASWFLGRTSRPGIRS